MSANCDRNLNISENKYAISYMENESIALELYKKTYNATCFNDERQCAIRKLAVDYDKIGSCVKEIDALNKLDKNFVVPYDDYWFEENYYVKQNYQDVNTNFNYGSLYLPHFSHLLHIKMPLYSLTLRNVIEELRSNYFDKSSNILSPCGYFVASQLFIEIINAVNYLHQQRPAIYHRNLKPENILLTLDGSSPDNFVRLTDAGLISLDSVCYHSFSNYNAPEVNNFRKFSAESDVFSLGVIAYQLFRVDFKSGMTYHDDVLQVKQHQLLEIINRLMSVFIDKRLSCTAILNKIGLWSLCYDDVRDDSTVKMIVAKSKTNNTIEANFIDQFVREKAKQNTPKLRKLSQNTNDMNNDSESVKNKLNPTHAHTNIYSKPTRSPSLVNKKPIFISYARKDASPHARSLKTWLNEYGCEVFLDVDEIKVGNDWQDDLNNGVLSCILFVALVTPTYGTTKWTKRELQLADTLNKHIIPISFIDNWPPVEIAINLLSTHFIPWKTEEDINESGDKVDGKAYDIRYWDDQYVQRIAKEIAEKLRRINQQKHYAPLSFPNKSFQSSLSANNGTNSSEKKLIVFSCHPNQYEFANQLRDELTEFGYDVWISCDEYEFNNSSISDQSFSSTDSLNRLSPMVAINPINYKQLRSKSSPELINSKSNNESNYAFNFRSTLKKASIVVLIISEDYCNSNTCKQQAFYCDQRLPIVAINYDNFQLPYDLKKLLEVENILERVDENNLTLVTTLMERIDKLSKLTIIKCNLNKFDGYDDRMYNLAQMFRKQVPIFVENYILVYIASSGKTLSNDAFTILKEIGKHLATIPQLKLIIGNNNGFEEVLVKSFIEQKDTNTDVYYILPVGLNAENGQTLNVGQNVNERDSVVSQLIPFCVLIDSGDEAIRIAEEFCWNDMFVIPVINETSLPPMIKEMPVGVNADHWNTLFETYETPVNIANALINIITCLYKSVCN